MAKGDRRIDAEGCVWEEGVGGSWFPRGKPAREGSTGPPFLADWKPNGSAYEREVDHQRLLVMIFEEPKWHSSVLIWLCRWAEDHAGVDGNGPVDWSSPEWQVSLWPWRARLVYKGADWLEDLFRWKLTRRAKQRVREQGRAGS